MLVRWTWWCLCVAAASAGVLRGQDRWQEFGSLARQVQAMPPTPTGDGHLGLIGSGGTAQVRLPVPVGDVAGYWLNLGNVVAYTGKGTSYQLVLRSDREDGPLLFEGPVIADGDAWNASNRPRIDITEGITAVHHGAGYIDVFVSARTDGDGWTLYRHNPQRPITATVAELTAELRLRMIEEKLLYDSGVCLLPVPATLTFTEGVPLVLTDQTTFHAPDQLAGAALELRAILKERVGITIGTAPKADAVIRLELGNTDGPESYRLAVKYDGAVLTAADAAGAFYGAVALAQLARGRNARVEAPACEIRDKPAFRDRIIQYDIARGQTVNVPYVKRLIRELARCRINGLLFYMEDDFRFRQFPFLGREGTFTHAKARELADYARGYHVRLIPQFEALGHAGAVLRHDELSSLREEGAGVFCTMEEGTWEFLDKVFAELAEAFPDSPYIHIGGDEFEHGFARCERCREFARREGVGALYARHLNRLNELVKSHGKTMMFWPSHSGPTPELSRMTIQNADALQKDCIPTEWIYHGPAAYPTIETYQELGFSDVHCCPAVESYSRVWPDYATTFRGIQGFYREGAAKGCGGAYCTTWEFMHGAILENSIYGLLFAAECSWNPASSSRKDFNRRFAGWWWGLTEAGDGDLVETLYHRPVPEEIPCPRVDGMPVRDALWCMPRSFLREICAKHSGFARQLPELGKAMSRTSALAQGMQQRAIRNAETLDAACLAFAMLRYVGLKATGIARAADCYGNARQAQTRDDRDRELVAATHALAELAAEASRLAAWYDQYVELRGAFAGDPKRLRDQAAELEAMARDVGGLDREPGVPLPPSTDLGLARVAVREVGAWGPDSVSDAGSTLRLDVTSLITVPGVYTFEFEYTRGMHGLQIREVSLVVGGEVLASDRHSGWAGSGSTGNIFTLPLEAVPETTPRWVVADVISRGGDDSHGTVWLITPDPHPQTAERQPR